METITRDAVQRALATGDLNPPPSPFLGILPPEMWGRSKKPLFAPINALAIPANGGQVVATFRADPNHDFVGFIATACVRTTDAAHTKVVDQPLLLLITMEDGTQFQPAGAGTQNEVDNLFGTARQPAVWSIPLIIPAGQQVQFIVTNNHNANVLDFRGTLQGFNVSLQ